LDLVRPVHRGATLGRVHPAHPGQRLAEQEQVGRPAPLVLVVHPPGPPRRRRLGRPGIREQLLGQLVHAHLGEARVVRPGVDLQHVLHPPHERPARLRRDHPLLPLPGLELVFFSTRRTVWYETASTTSSSTSRSAKSRRLQRACPSGGWEQASATRWASCSPSSLRRYSRRGARRFSAASTPSSAHCLRRRETGRWLVSGASTISASDQAGPPDPWSAFSRTRAWASVRAGAVPAAIRRCSDSRSSGVSSTTYFLRIPQGYRPHVP